MPRAPLQVLVIPYRRRADGGLEFAVFRRADGSMWQFLAGGGEDDETTDAAAAREAFEEAAVPLESPLLRLDSTASVPRDAFPGGAHWPADVFVVPEHAFAVDVADHPVRLSAEHASVEWLAFDVARQRLTWQSNQVALWELRERLRRADGIDLPPPPGDLRFDAVTLAFATILPGDPARGFAPAYHFRIHVDGRDVGRINFRVGDSAHVEFTAGHIGFEIAGPSRGHGYAYQACRALGPFVRTMYPSVIVTCDPANAPSRRTIARLGAAFLDEVPVPTHEPAYARGSRSKLRYRWAPDA